MATGVAGAVLLSFSGLVVDQAGIATALLLLVPLPLPLSAIAWIPMFRSNPIDRTALHQALLRRREELLGRAP